MHDLPFSRQNPSPFYKPLLAQYETMHSGGYDKTAPNDQYKDAQEVFPGNELVRYADAIKVLIDYTGARSVLDYGAGKGKQYEWQCIPSTAHPETRITVPEFWGISDIRLFEPAVSGTVTLPDKADGVICTDVLEHVHMADLPWVTEELFQLADKFVFANVSCVPALALLKNGENAHISIRPAIWWGGFFQSVAARYPHIEYVLNCEENHPQQDQYRFRFTKTDYSDGLNNLESGQNCFTCPLENDVRVEKTAEYRTFRFR